VYVCVAIKAQKRQSVQCQIYRRPTWFRLEMSTLRNMLLNTLMGTLKSQSNGALYSNTVTGILAVDGWTVTFGTAMREMGGAAARSGPSSLYHM